MRYLMTMVLAFSFFVTPEAQAIPRSLSWFGSIMTGALVGGPALLLPQGWKALSIPLFGGGLVAGKYFFDQFTPDGRMKRAEHDLYQINLYPLAKKFHDKDQLFSALEDAYVTHHWPLVNAFNDLASYIALSKKAEGLAIAAKQEDASFFERAMNVRHQIDFLSSAMRTSLKSIRANEEYLKQLEQFKSDLYHKEQIAVQKSMAFAALSNAEAQHKIAKSQSDIAEVKKRKLENSK